MNTTPLRIAIVQAKFKTADFTFNCQKIVELTQRSACRCAAAVVAGIPSVGLV